ncbi:DUF2142 domain-containing protein [Microbacterium sp. LWH10-1.2]|uniref:DUF2142 domain-containing protein n=1 Tax=unclassified Microbacterium TaxID=2609290 RepID=UPI003138993E
MSRPKQIIGTIVAGLALMLTLSMWAFSSPVGASPDEDFHLASAWCGNGEREGLCEAGHEDETRLVPDKALEANCYAFQPQTSAACQGKDFLDEGFSLIESDRVNSEGQYPSGFYFVSSLFTSDNIAVSTIAIRLAHSAIFTVLVMVTWWLLPRRLRFTMSASVLLTLVPLGLFVIASPNPSSWAVLSTAVLFPALLGYFTTRGAQRVGLAVISAIAALIGFSSRGDSAAYAAVAIAAAMVLAFRPSKAYVLRAIVPAALIAAAGIAFLAAGQTGRALEGWTDDAPGSGGLMSIVNNFLALPSLWTGALGMGWGLGWLDTGMPAILWAATLFCFVGVLFAALRWQGWRKLIALIGTGASVIVIPLYILYTGNAMVGENVQPRYLLPLLTLFLATALAPSIHGETVSENRPPHGPVRLNGMQLWVIVALISGAQALAIYTNTKRYSGSGILAGKTAWWWDAGPTPLAVCVVGALAFAVLAVLWAVDHTRDGVDAVAPNTPSPATSVDAAPTSLVEEHATVEDGIDTSTRPSQPSQA